MLGVNVKTLFLHTISIRVQRANDPIEPISGYILFGNEEEEGAAIVKTKMMHIAFVELQQKAITGVVLRHLIGEIGWLSPDMAHFSSFQRRIHRLGFGYSTTAICIADGGLV